ncbi:MAG: AAA domain-containing protein [Candidatus Izemoplasmatales bacterium]
MAYKRNALLEELFNLRDNLRLKLLSIGEEKLICNDEALVSMAKIKPTRLSDFLAISGLDSDFLEEFAHLFLDLISVLTKKDIKKVKVSKEASIVLDRYKDRLTDISRSNPNLYMGRIEKLRSFDLYNEERLNDLNDFLSLRKKSLKFDASIESEFNNLTTLYRYINKDFKDFGTYHLYLAYPYVEGIFKKDNFAIKAPLAYLPVKLERIRKNYTLLFDSDKDIVINRDLLLTVLKMEKSSLEKDSPELSDLSHKTIKEVLIPFYNLHGLNIKMERTSEFISFKNELKEDFLKKKNYGFYLKPYITFGRYQLFSSMIQKDMADIIESNTYNELLEGLIDEANLFDIEQPLNVNVISKDVDESGLVYINDINSSQEKVIEMVEKEKKVVIWGPPGTGKSQTITSLIAHQVLRNENVLVVSEKKVALDVIYHRLGEASKYVMFIDDASAKGMFYDKLSHFIDQSPPSRSHNNDIYHLEEEIKDLDRTFNQALKLLYKTSSQYKPLFSFYERYLKDKDVLEDLLPKSVYQILYNKLNHPSFSDIEILEKTFDKESKLQTFLDYQEYLNKYPWFYKLETKISRSSAVEFQIFINDLNEYYIKKEKLGFFRKRRLQKTFLDSNLLRLSFLSTRKYLSKLLIKTLIKDQVFAKYLENNLKSLNKIKTNYQKLTLKEVNFLNVVITEETFASLRKQNKLKAYIFDAYITGFLEDFKANNQKYLYILDSYEKKINELKALMEEKRNVARESFEMKLFTQALEFSNTKRIMDIKRVLESDKLPSIKAFFDMFSVELLSFVKVWLLTPEVISSILPLKFNLFDLVIFDEASQMYVEKGIPAIYRAKKVVIAGDPKQLRPSSLGMGRLVEDDFLEEDEILKNVTFDAKSLLDLARYRYKEALLNYHYRSKYQELIEFSNHAFYDGKLLISPNVITPKTPPISYVYVKNGTFLKKSNVEEAKEVINVLKKVLKDKEKDESVGIITFNSSQRDLILNQLDEELFKKSVHQARLEKEIFRKEPSGDQSLFVKNIENVQGDERDIIIFSMGYAQDETGVVKRRFGWLNHEGGQNRLNVAITRARKKIIFVSSLYPEQLRVDDLSGKGPKLLKDFMRYCFYISNRNRDLAKEVLMSLYKKESVTKKILLKNMASNISQRLTKLGYVVESEIGIGQFKMDLAIYDEISNRYLLGIICDLNVNEGFTARKELLHQEKFLQARGWNVKRIFHMNWYENPNKVLKEIKDLLKVVG